jgi:hypothetical protein
MRQFLVNRSVKSDSFGRLCQLSLRKGHIETLQRFVYVQFEPFPTLFVPEKKVFWTKFNPRAYTINFFHLNLILQY